MKRLLTLALTLALSTSTLTAQISLYEQAHTAYNLGHFAAVDSLLADGIKTIKGDERVQGYRLLALSSLCQDRNEAAETYVRELLALDPYYTAYNENPRFADIVERLKAGKATITTASKVAESIEEVPVPVTLITEEMIRASGARNLQELLILFVPGFSEVGSIEDNVSMRGIYGMSQDAILVMIDGHRMNSHTTNAAVLDFRNNLEKIKQIEVLRGPASSLYGNVALSAVVNIITRSGAEMDGGKITALYGKNKSLGASFVLGKGNIKSEFLAWASFYNSQGEAVQSCATTHYLGAYKDKPSFDFGAKVRWDDFKIEVVGQHGHKVPYGNLLSESNVFSYDKYSQKNGEGPGFSSTQVRADIDYNHSWGNWALNVNLYAATENVQMYNVLGDTIRPMTAYILREMMGLSTSVKNEGLFQCIDWSDYSFGGIVSGSYEYKIHNGMSGNVIFGLQEEGLYISSANMKIGADYNQTNNVSDTMLIQNRERIISGFVQLKHNFTHGLIFNGGLRSDHKLRQDGRKLNNLSPRVSLIWLATPRLSFKGGYSYSFVDVPLFYRASKIPLFSGGTNLNPETMDAFQLSGNYNNAKLHLQAEVNLFYNNASGVLFYNMAEAEKATEIFNNSGRISMGGVEGVLQYSTDYTLGNLNITYQYPFRVENYNSTSEHVVPNVPSFLLNLTGARRIKAFDKIGAFWVRANLHVQSSVECRNNDILAQLQYGGAMPSMNEDQLTPYHQPAVAILGAGVEWQSKFGLAVAFDTYNLTNTKYTIGGQIYTGIPAQGFNCLGRISYKF